MPETEKLETFTEPDNRAPTHGIISHRTEELTALCPFNYDSGHVGQDIYMVEIRYRADPRVLETKSLRLYFESFRGERISHEKLTERIYSDLRSALQTDELRVKTEQNMRGGISSTVVRGGVSDER